MSLHIFVSPDRSADFIVTHETPRKALVILFSYTNFTLQNNLEVLVSVFTFTIGRKNSRRISTLLFYFSCSTPWWIVSPSNLHGSWHQIINDVHFTPILSYWLVVVIFVYKLPNNNNRFLQWKVLSHPRNCLINGYYSHAAILPTFLLPRSHELFLGLSTNDLKSNSFARLRARATSATQILASGANDVVIDLWLNNEENQN